MFALLFALAASVSRRHKVRRMKNSEYGTVTASELNVRSGPGTSYSIITCIYKGAIVEIISESNGWYKVYYSGSNVGWVSGSYVTKAGSSSGTRMTDFYLTGYYPDDSPMEGGYFDCLGNDLSTLQQYLNYNAKYVSIAVDKTLIALKSIVHIDGFTRDGEPVKFWACDVGSAIKNKHIDICVANEQESYKVTKHGASITVYGVSARPT